MGNARANPFVRRLRTPIPQSRTPSAVPSSPFKFSPYQEGQDFYQDVDYPDQSDASGHQFLTPSTPSPSQTSGRKVTYFGFNACSQF
jgi:hypothetical protein